MAKARWRAKIIYMDGTEKVPIEVEYNSLAGLLEDVEEDWIFDLVSSIQVTRIATLAEIEAEEETDNGRA